MRRVILVSLITAGFVLCGTIAEASTRSSAPVDDPTTAYWNEAQQLTQAQLTLLDRVDQATPNPDAKRLRTLHAQLFLYVSSVDRFLQANHPEPQAMCSPEGEIAGTDAASLEQVQVYCALYQSTQDLMALRARLDREARIISATRTGTPVAERSAQLPASSTQASVKLVNALTENVAVQEIEGLVKASRQRLVLIQSTFPASFRLTIKR